MTVPNGVAAYWDSIAMTDKGNELRLIACPRPFSADRIDQAIPVGGSITDIMDGLALDPVLLAHAHVWITDGAMITEPVMVPRDHWARVRPKAGAVVTLRVAPGKGGGGGKNPLRTILTIAVVAAAFVLGPAVGAAMGLPTEAVIFGQTINLAAAVGGAAITMVGNLIVNAIAPPPRPKLAELSMGGPQSRTSPTLAITGTQNRANRYGAVPRIYGRHRVFPVLAAHPHSEVEGDEQYLRMLFDFGYGPLELTDLRIGAIPLAQFEGVETEIRQGYATDAPVTLYTDTIREDQYSLKVTNGAGPEVLETRDGADEIIIDITFRGLVRFDDSGNRQDRSVEIKVEYRIAGSTGAWTEYATNTYTAASEQVVRRGVRIITPVSGRYELRFTRLTEDNTSTRVRDDSFISTIRTVQHTAPVKATGRCLVAMRIKATDQLNGVVNQFSAVIQARLPIWDGAQWVEQTTRHPAWVYLDVLRGPANRRPVSDDRLDLDGFKAWADATPDYTFDAVIDYPTTVFELLRDVAAAGRAGFGMRDGKFSIVRDVVQSVPIQHFTPRNTMGFRGIKAFTQIPHGLKCRFVNPDRDWQQDEVIVYADGYHEANANRFETLELFGCTSADLAWKHGRYHLAVGKLRPETYEVSVDIDHLVCTAGDLVKVSHDVPLWGGGWGRIKDVTYDVNGDVASVTLDDVVAMETGKIYAVRFRHADGVSSVASVATEPGETSVLSFLTPLAVYLAPEPGDLALFGEAERESASLIVKAIRHSGDFRATLTLVDAASEVHEGDTGPIPDFDSLMTLPPETERQVPGVPVIEEVISDEDALVIGPDGRAQSRILVRVTQPQGLNSWAEVLQAHFRRTGSNARWTVLPVVPISSEEIAVQPVEDSVAYDVRLRAVSQAGHASEWAIIENHVVVGKTTPPSDVADFQATRRADGVQLSWDPVSELDVIGYEVRDGEAWDTGVVVTTRHRGTSLFVALNDAGDHRFHIRAIDELGLQSISAVSVTASVVPPANVSGFDVIPQGEHVRFSWVSLPISGVEYEIRAGESWGQGRFVGRSAGDHLVSLWPVRNAADETFWCKAVSAAGLYSVTASFATTRLAPLSDRNVILQSDRKALGWPGVLHDLEVATDDLLALTRTGGVNAPTGAYYFNADLGQVFRARNWMASGIVAIPSDPATWTDAAFIWNEGQANAPWLPVGDADGAELKTVIAVNTAPGADLVEGFPLDGDASGLKGAEASKSLGLGFADARFAKGLQILDITQVAWPISVPAEFSTSFDLRFDELLEEPQIYVTWSGGSGVLSLGYEPGVSLYYLEDHLGNRIGLSLPRIAGDIITFGVSQSAIDRSLHAASWKSGDVMSTTQPLVPIGTFDQLRLYP